MMILHVKFTIRDKSHLFYIIHLQIDVQVSDKSALHCAVAKNHTSVLNVLLEFNPNLEIKVFGWKKNICILSFLCRMKMGTRHFI